MMLSNAEWLRLESFLVSDGTGDKALFIDELHGLLTAVACSPVFIPPGEWLPVVYDGIPDFANRQEEADLNRLLIRVHNEIVAALTEGREPLPLFLLQEGAKGESVLDPRGWCQGFVQGMRLRRDMWSHPLDEKLHILLYPILFLAAERERRAEAESADPSAGALHEALSDLVPHAVAAIFAFWQGEKGGRGMPSPLCCCASGKPFEACCGEERQLH